MNFFLIIKKEVKVLLKLIIPIFIVMTLSFTIMSIILTMSFSVKTSMLSTISTANTILRNEGYENIDNFNDYNVKIELTNVLEREEYLTFKTDKLEITLDDKWRYRQDLVGNIEFKNENDPNFKEYSGNIKGSEYELTKSGTFISFNKAYQDKLLEQYIINTYSNVENPIIISETFNRLLNLNRGDSITIINNGVEVTGTVIGFYSNIFSTHSYIMDTSCVKDFDINGYVLTFILNDLNQYFDFVNDLESYRYISLSRDLSYENSISLINVIYTVLTVLTILMTVILTVTIYSFLNTIINRRRKFLYQLKLIGFNNIKLILCYSSFMFVLIFVGVLVSFGISSIAMSLISKYYLLLLGSEFTIRFAVLSPIILLVLFTIVSVGILSISLNNKTTKKAIEKIRGV